MSSTRFVLTCTSVYRTMVRFLRIWTRTATLVAGVALAVAGGLWYHGRGEAPSAQVVSSLQFADSVTRQPDPLQVGEAGALAAIYMERSRLGMGSPFRLMDQALADPLLPMDLGRQVAYAILARTAEGISYGTPGEALELLASRGRGNGLAHRAFIEQTLAAARDVRAGELALRMAYQISAAGGLTSPRAGAVSLAAIAQGRDRLLAQRDAERLIAYAQRRRLDPLQIVSEWRQERRFAVERPLVDPPSESQEREAVRLLPQLLVTLDTLRAPIPRSRRDRGLDSATTRAAIQVALSRHAPPQAPVVVTMGGFSSYVVQAGENARSRAVRSRFVESARTEEGLVASFAQLQLDDPRAPEAALAVLTAAVAMRPYAQETPWFPGDTGPTGSALKQKHALASVEFDENVPRDWHSYYTRMLDVAVRDLRHVFPALDLTGLRIRFGNSPLGERALALHDPRSRTVYFPIHTGAGAMAHELSHDLDWQAARKRYGAQASYRTDRSMRQYRDGLASTLDRMAAGAVRGRRGAPQAPGGDRPTEAFARGVDYIVAATLARDGIMNGYLSAVQDEWITGYASATVPRRDQLQPDPTMSALQEIADVAPRAAEWFEDAYGSARRVGANDVVRRVLLAPFPRLQSDGRGSAIGWPAATRMLRSNASVASAWACQLKTPWLASSDREAIARAMELAAEYRVRGVMDRWSDYFEHSQARGRLRALGGAPANPDVSDAIARELKGALLWRSARMDDGRPGTDLLEHIQQKAASASCWTS